jgi:hypothetical protein
MNSPEVTAREAIASEEHLAQSVSPFVEEEIQEERHERKEKHLERVSAHGTLSQILGFPGNERPDARKDQQAQDCVWPNPPPCDMNWWFLAGNNDQPPVVSGFLAQGDGVGPRGNVMSARKAGGLSDKANVGKGGLASGDREPQALMVRLRTCPHIKLVNGLRSRERRRSVCSSSLKLQHAESILRKIVDFTRLVRASRPKCKGDTEDGN